ncbi:MAG: chalcone isomerase family protein [Thermoanaerobaculia bacterium]
MKKLILAGVATIFVSSVGFSAQLAGVTLPDSVSVSGKTIKLNGLGVRTKLFFKIYVAGLYLETPTHDETQAVTSEETKKVLMHFLYKKVTAKQLVDGWEDGFRDNSPAEIGKLKGEIAQFESWMTDLTAGQEMAFSYVPGIGTTVEILGHPKGTIPGQDFMRALFRVWLGVNPPTGELKSGMLGK